MNADPKTSFEPHSREQLPNSNRVYEAGIVHPAIRVPFREISQSPTHLVSGAEEVNPPVQCMTARALGEIRSLTEHPKKGCHR